jgi:septum site-determining protein MinC
MCVLETDARQEEVFAKALRENAPAASEEKKIPDNLLQNDHGTGFFFKGNLRSGQVLDVETSIIILGDVNAGAKVVSKGNVIILGSLKGNVFAGSGGNVDAFVVALDMSPVQIRIADTIARSPDESPKKSKQKETKIAFWEDGNIYIEPLDKEVLGDIRLS